MTDSLGQLRQALSELRIQTPELLLVEAPGNTWNDVRGGVVGLVTELQALVGPFGTLVIPTCTASEGRPKPIFDPLLSPSEVGPLSEFFRGLPGAVRSHSPTHSVAARGPLAESLIAGHRSALGRPTPWGEGAFGRGSPWDMLAELDGWWLMIDAAWAGSPFTDYVSALYAERHQEITKSVPYPRFDASAVGRVLTQAAILKQGIWAGRPLCAFRTKAAVEAVLKALEHDPGHLTPGPEWGAWLAATEEIRQHGHLFAGTAKATLTPAVPCRRWDGKSLTGVYRDLYARVLVLKHGQEAVALVICDLLGLASYLTQQIRQRVQAETGLAGDRIMIACTHAHSTPDTVGAGNEDPVYLARLVETVASAIGEAYGRLRPARMGWGSTTIRGLAHSRRIKLKDGGVYTTRYGVPSTWRVLPQLIESEGAIDPTLAVLRVEDLQGHLLAVASNFGCHANVALTSTNVSGDFPGEALHVLEQALGGGTLALFTNGTAADVDPTLEMPYWGPRNDANALRLGRIFAAQVLEILERTDVAEVSSVGGARRAVQLPVRNDWIQMLEMEKARLTQEFASVELSSEPVTRTLRERIINTEVQVLCLNDYVLIGMPGEVFTSTGFKLKARLPGRKVAVVELANDYLGYLLTPEAAYEGGYETGLNLWSRVTPEAEERLLQAAESAVTSPAGRETMLDAK